MREKRVTVIGSINMDLVTSTKIIPRQGETVMGSHFMTAPGGKGANQAVAASRLGVEVIMIGCVGTDQFGDELKAHLKSQGVNTTYIRSLPGVHTGIASITLAESDNSIIVVPGANELLTPSIIEENEEIIAKSDIILLQLEIPIETVNKAAEIAAKYEKIIILNPAPMRELSKELLSSVHYITPNEHEMKLLMHSHKDNERIKAKLVVTKGEEGVDFYEHGSSQHLDSFQVSAVDTTGAGDSFNGALAVALSEGKSLKQACEFGSAAGALTVTKLGAQTGMPTKDEVLSFLKKHTSNANHN